MDRRTTDSLAWATLPVLVLATLHGIAAPIEPSDPEKNRKLHTPAEIVKIMEDSALVYELALDDTLAPSRIEPAQVLSDQMLLKEKEGGGHTLTFFNLSEAARAMLMSAEDAFAKEDYGAALERYANLQEMDPGYTHVQVLIGDVFYSKGEFKEAMAAYKEAIRSNFVDYQAHWFLADALWNLGDRQEAIRSLTRAHLLNVNHKVLRDKLIHYRTEIGRPWKDWTYEPRYEVEQEGKKIKVRFAKDWMGYAIVKAVWAFEPGYALEMEGPDHENRVIRMAEEKEALVARMAMDEKVKFIEKIITEGYTNEFIYYELLARRAPEAIVVMPRPIFMRLVDYVDIYH